MSTIIFLAIFQTGLLFTDGYSTVNSTGILPPREVGIARHFIGEYPTWESMIPWGIAEVAASSSVSYILKKKGVKYWYVPQIGISLTHGTCATINFVNFGF